MIQVCGWSNMMHLIEVFEARGISFWLFVCNISMILKQMMQDKTLQKPGVFFLGNGHRFEVWAFFGGTHLDSGQKGVLLCWWHWALKQLAKLRLGFRVPKRYRLLSRMKGETKPKSKQPNISALNFLTPDPFRSNRVANDQFLFGGPQFMACVTS